MGIMKAIGDFLFGKDPDIFDESGQVRHKFPESKWQKWNDRLKASSDYDWRQHGARERAFKANQNKNGDNKPKH